MPLINFPSFKLMDYRRADRGRHSRGRTADSGDHTPSPRQNIVNGNVSRRSQARINRQNSRTGRVQCGTGQESEIGARGAVLTLNRHRECRCSTSDRGDTNDHLDAPPNGVDLIRTVSASGSRRISQQRPSVIINAGRRPTGANYGVGVRHWLTAASAVVVHQNRASDRSVSNVNDQLGSRGGGVKDRPGAFRVTRLQLHKRCNQPRIMESERAKHTRGSRPSRNHRNGTDVIGTTSDQRGRRGAVTGSRAHRNSASGSARGTVTTTVVKPVTHRTGRIDHNAEKVRAVSRDPVVNRHYLLKSFQVKSMRTAKQDSHTGKTRFAYSSNRFLGVVDLDQLESRGTIDQKAKTLLRANRDIALHKVGAIRVGHLHTDALTTGELNRLRIEPAHQDGVLRDQRSRDNRDVPDGLDGSNALTVVAAEERAVEVLPVRILRGTQQLPVTRMTNDRIRPLEDLQLDVDESVHQLLSDSNGGRVGVSRRTRGARNDTPIRQRRNSLRLHTGTSGTGSRERHVSSRSRSRTKQRTRTRLSEAGSETKQTTNPRPRTSQKLNLFLATNAEQQTTLNKVEQSRGIRDSLIRDGHRRCDLANLSVGTRKRHARERVQLRFSNRIGCQVSRRLSQIRDVRRCSRKLGNEII